MNKKLKFMSFSISAVLSLIITLTLWMLIMYNIINVRVEQGTSFVNFVIFLAKANIAYAIALTLISIVGIRSAFKLDRMTSENNQ